MLRLLISCAVLASLFPSCINYRYVNTFDSEDVIYAEDSFKFENEDLIISYDFSRGFMEFSVYNKGEKALFIDWKRSYVTLNENRYSYYQDDYDFSRLKNISYKDERAVSTSIRVSPRERHTGYIFPMSYRTIRNVKVKVKLFTSYRKPIVKEVKYNGMKVDTFNSSTSPLVIRNSIFYSFDRELEPAMEVSNNFWLSEAAIMRSSKYRKYHEGGSTSNTHMVEESTPNLALLGVLSGVFVGAGAIFIIAWSSI